MGSYISVGFIYDKISIDNIKNKMKSLIDFIVSKKGEIKRAKICKDIYGDEWIEYELNDNTQIDNMLVLLAEHYFGQIEIETNLFDLMNLDITVHVEKEEGYFGFILDISESAFYKDSLNMVNSYTDKFIDLMKKFYKCSAYNYAFCDNEAEIKYSPLAFRNLNKRVYSLAILPVHNNNLRVIKSEWNIDGITNRN
ncbi:Imm64 family immunity protein [Anaeromicropila herbilytica]|uniref:Uncharacterized protein n=1 Tax=Anaeromicropila herbilytica TaxID=2785025 RepID=A0A7R7EHQ4_9FIRM|nr:Imm64 family immunity protein [Anaeromicropila herbilytica]BCN29440.1 hypothetical protein bsdtb5_07350 [Anaeromicropila herbilytica]